MSYAARILTVKERILYEDKIAWLSRLTQLPNSFTAQQYRHFLTEKQMRQDILNRKYITPDDAENLRALDAAYPNTFSDSPASSRGSSASR